MNIEHRTPNTEYRTPNVEVSAYETALLDSIIGIEYYVWLR